MSERCIGQRVRGFDIRPRGRLQVRGKGHRDTPRPSKTKEELETLEKVAVTVTEIAITVPCCISFGVWFSYSAKKCKTGLPVA
ncbi:hypothetical protein MTP99_007722 [Tenebrio molitor]|jgi:hypothetical protein|nr:hypothetical protein MTP99_007722 [Tenebrio molitor]